MIHPDAPKPEALFPWGTQIRRLYDALTTEGEVTNLRIRRGLRIRFYAPLIDQIGKTVRPYGLDVKRNQINRGVCAYRLGTTGGKS